MTGPNLKEHSNFPIHPANCVSSFDHALEQCWNNKLNANEFSSGGLLFKKNSETSIASMGLTFSLRFNLIYILLRYTQVNDTIEGIMEDLYGYKMTSFPNGPKTCLEYWSMVHGPSFPVLKQKTWTSQGGPQKPVISRLITPLDYRGEITNPSYQYNYKAIERLGFLIAVYNW